ncbi:MAG: hypothetical protein C0473_02465 [Cyanobacteria bacterium DS3.002]|nr:hypothetical protein [Cyanobacteria bacterium DS3.002]
MSNTPVPQPIFMIEMSHQLRHIIMKRSYFLRSTKARTLFCREKIAGKSWLEVALTEKPKTDVLPWDQAHNLAERFKAELKADVFVEPAHEAGRHHQLTAPKNSANLFNDDDVSGNRGHGAFGFDPMTTAAGAGMEMFGGSVRRSGPGSGQFGIAPTNTGMGLGIDVPNIPGMPNIGGSNSPFNIGGRNQNPADFLPAHVREALSFGDDKKNSEITLPALRELPAFGELPKATGLMYEVEAVQVLQGLMIQVGPSEHSEQSLVALTKLENVSRRLKRFLVDALPVAA